MSEPAAQPPLPASPPTYEDRLPGWQRWLNTTCENWIFAFIVAMAIRHFCLEAFRIPTASMEPMLYGDPAFSKSDHVVVDKFLFRFTGPERWGVTVFQFPQPEIEGAGDARTAYDASGKRLDKWMLRPLMYRNFVKRAVVLPRDTFYIAGGDIYLKQPDGSWKVSRKPERVQEELWQEVYHHGAQAGYLPWVGDGGSQAKADGAAVTFTLAEGGAVTFDQPLRNLYLKPGTFRVRPYHPGDEDPDVADSLDYEGQSELAELSMTKPLFQYHGTNRTGNAWHLEEWTLRRMTSADLDNSRHGTQLNKSMREFVRDVRLRGRLSDLTGTVSLQLQQGNVHRYRLTITASGWTLTGDDRVLKSGSESLDRKPFAFFHLDNQIGFTVDGRPLFLTEVPAVDASQRLSLRVEGKGTASLSDLALDRDVHYTISGFMRDETLTERRLQQELDSLPPARFVNADQVDASANALRNIHSVRAQMLGKTIDQLTPAERGAALGYSPETAITAPEGAYLMLGDNSPLSWDGRSWGWVPVENLRGRVLAVILPFSRWRVVR
jgi:signal peptidase I